MLKTLSKIINNQKVRRVAAHNIGNLKFNVPMKFL